MLIWSHNARLGNRSGIPPLRIRSLPRSLQTAADQLGSSALKQNPVSPTPRMATFSPRVSPNRDTDCRECKRLGMALGEVLEQLSAMQDDNEHWMRKVNSVRKEQLTSLKTRLEGEKEQLMRRYESLMREERLLATRTLLRALRSGIVRGVLGAIVSNLKRNLRRDERRTEAEKLAAAQTDNQKLSKEKDDLQGRLAEQQRSLHQTALSVEAFQKELQRRRAMDNADEAALASFLEEREEQLKIIFRLKRRVMGHVVVAWRQRAAVLQTLVVSRQYHSSQTSTLNPELNSNDARQMSPTLE